MYDAYPRYMDMTIKKGRRWATSVGYLHPVLLKRNVTTVTKALVHHVVFEGKKAVGIQYKVKDRNVEQVNWTQSIHQASEFGITYFHTYQRDTNLIKKTPVQFTRTN